MMMLINVIMCMIHMNSLNLIQHKNYIFMVFIVTYAMMIGGINFYFMRKDDYEFDQSTALNLVVILILGCFLFMFVYAQMKLDGY